MYGAASNSCNGGVATAALLKDQTLAGKPKSIPGEYPQDPD
jgi:hypothetical protein